MSNLDKAPRRPNVLLGIAFMVVGVSMLPAMNTMAKSLAAEYPVLQVVWARFLGHLLWMLLLFGPTAKRNIFHTSAPHVQWARSAIFFVSNVCFIAALTWVPIATASAIMFTTPLVVTALSAPLLGERVGVWRWIAVCTGFSGAVLIVQPGTDIGNPGAALVLVSAGCFGVYQILTRKIAHRDRPETSIVYTALAGALLVSLSAPWFAVLPARPLDWLLFAGVGLVGGSAQFLIIKALQNGPASVISPIGYAELLSAVFFGYAVFGDFPDRMTWVGAAIIIASGVFIAWRERHVRQ